MNVEMQKTEIRKKLEELEEEVHKSWLKDLDKTKEFAELIVILDKIYQSESIEAFFQNNQSDFTYFIGKFSYETISNILRQHYVFGDNGDEVAFEVLHIYLKIFVKFMEKHHYLQLFDSVKEIFDPSKSYYRGHSYTMNKVMNEKKILSAERYNEKLPRLKNTLEITPGQEIDIFSESRKSYNPNQERKIWTRGIVHKVDSEFLTVLIADDDHPVYLKKLSFDYAPKGTMAKDYDWRISLENGDSIDCYDRGKWYPSTVLSSRKENINGLIRAEYKIGFRLYTENFPQWKEYQKFWPDKIGVQKDSNGREYIGDSENVDEVIPSYSKRIQKLNTCIYNEGYSDSNDNENYLVDEFDAGNEKNYVIARNNSFSYYFAKILTEYAKLQGFEKMVRILASKDKPHGDIVCLCFNILSQSSSLFHKEYIRQIGEEMKNNVVSYLNDLTQNELRNIKKDTIDVILKVLKFYLNFTVGVEEKNKIIEKFSITFSTKMLKTSFLDKRIQAVKTLVDIIRTSKGDLNKSQMILKILEESQIFNEIYGPNSHIQLINKSKDLLEIMIQEDKLSDGEMELIWAATKKGDLEGKLTILKTLKEISKSLKHKHIQLLLNNIYSSSGELIKEEIDLIYELSIQASENLERCINFFTQSLLLSKSDEGEKITTLINKIFEITKFNPSFKINVIELCIGSLNKNENTILALKILQKYIKEINISNDYDLYKLLIEDNKLNNLFCSNFVRYKEFVKEKSKNFKDDIDLLPIDNFTHSQNVKARLEFVNILLSNNLWKMKEDPIDFLYSILLDDYISEKDSHEFYNWIKRIIEEDVIPQERIYNLFSEKICRNSCNNLSIQAFDSYLKVFLDFNEREKNLKYLKNSKSFEVVLLCDPEKLVGFEMLWKIVFESFSKEIMNKGIEILHILYTVASINGCKGDQSQKLLQRCIDLIRNTVDSTANEESKHNIINKCLYVLKLMLEESEKNGTAGVKSHSGLLKRNIISLKVIDNIERNTEFFIRVYSNTTMWDLKVIIGKKIKICFDFLKFTIKNNFELKNTDNGKNILEMNLSDNDEIKVSKNTVENQIKQVDLVINGDINPTAMKIFNDWFDEFSTDNQMSREDCARFVRSVTGQKDEGINVEDTRIKNLFEAYDRNRDGFLEREEFVGFYKECSMKPDKRRAVIDNLKSMGIRNDLKRMDEPYENHNLNKKVLPRYNLSNNQDFFDTLFKLQDLGDSIASEAFNFLGLISTNPEIYKNILFFQGDNWNQQIDANNLYKLIYSLQIIESFLEDFDVDTNVDSREKQDFAEDVGIKPEEFKQRKIDWIENFVEKGGFNHIVKIFNQKLEEYVSSLNKPISVMMKLCIEFLLKIIRLFYFSSLRRTGDGNGSEKLDKNSLDISAFQAIFKEKLVEIINKSIDSLFYTEKLIDLISALFDESTKSLEDFNILENSFDFLSALLGYSENVDSLENFILTKKQTEFNSFSIKGLLNSYSSIRQHFSHSFIKLCKACHSQKRFSFLSYIFSFIFDVSSNLNKEQEKNSTEFFEFFSTLLELYLSSPENYTFEKSINPREFIEKLIETVYTDINEDGNVSLSNELFIGYMKIITNVCDSIPEIKNVVSSKYNLIQAIMTRILFKQNSSELKEKLSRLNFINPEEFEDNKSNRTTNQILRQICYNFILKMLKNSIENFEKFFSVNILDSEKKDEKKVSAKEFKYYYISNYGRSEGHVGLKNLGCICYMNAMLQQYFMTPALRYNILKVNDNQQPSRGNAFNIDDNVLHQVQRMFSFLELSQRQDYNPHGFCYSFKDFDGNPTNTMVQQDSQEFLNRFFDKVENCLKPTPYKYLLQSVYGGKTCSQLICENGCGRVNNRYEDFYNLSLEVNNMKTLNDSLEKFITPELIDEYKCEGCNKKVTIKKRNSLAELPNVLIVHLQRIFYNYETDRNEKINSRLEFPRVLNLKPFTIEELTRQSACKTKKMEEEIQIETDETYFKHPSYYEYHLVGVVVHTGSADSGHYYSYINTVRNGQDNEMNYNPNNENHVNSWLEFNDSYISKFNVSRLEEECFGGSYTSNNDSWSRMGEKIKSAYMLIYERRMKSPLKVIIPENLVEENNNLVSFKEEETHKIRKTVDLFRFIGTKEYLPTKDHLFKSVFYDVAKNENFQYIPYYTNLRLIPKQYYLEVTEDNSVFQKQQNISDEYFVSFFDSVINVLDDTLSQMEEISEETSIKIATTFMNFIFNILSQKDKHKLLKTAKDKFLHILGLSSSSLKYVIEYLIASQKQLVDNLLNESTFIISTNCDLLYELIKQAYIFNPQLFLSSSDKKTLGNTLSDNLVKLLDILLSLFPKVPSKYVAKISPLLMLLKRINELGDEMSIYFLNRAAISTFITYLLGKESPSYNETVLKQGEHWDIGRFNIGGIEETIDLIYNLFSKTDEKPENKSLEENQTVIKLSEKDKKHIKHSHFMKFLFKNNENIFSRLLLDLSYQNEEFTKKSCNEITKYIEDIGLYDDTELLKLLHAIEPLLALQDNYQKIRFEYIIGFPQIIIEEPTSKYVFPYFGFNKMRDESSKVYEYTGLTNHRLTSCLMKKLFNIRGVEKAPCEIFLNILEAADKNPYLLKYIRFMPAESIIDGDFIMWGVQSIKRVSKKYTTDFDERLEILAQSINNKLSSIFYDNEILHSFKGFIDINQKYLMTDVIREEITLVSQKDNVYLLQIEYFTTVEKVDENLSLDYGLSRSNDYGEEEKEEKIKAEDYNKFTENETSVTIDQVYKIPDEKEFFKQILVHFTQGKKVIVKAQKSTEAPVYATLIRYVILNNTSKEATINLKIKRQTTPETCNEYIPQGPLHCEINSNSCKNIYSSHKLYPQNNWTDNLSLEYDFNVVLSQYRVMQATNYPDQTQNSLNKNRMNISNDIYNRDYEVSVMRRHPDFNHDSSDDD